MMVKKKPRRKHQRTVAEQISYLNPKQVSSHPWQALVAGSRTSEYSHDDAARVQGRVASVASSDDDFQIEDNVFEDPDYILPEQVRQVLAKEGLAKVSLDSVLKDREKLHKRAKYINREVSQGEFIRFDSHVYSDT